MINQNRSPRLVQGIIIKTHPCVRQDKQVRQNLSEQHLDKMINDSFPANDPISLF